MNANQTKPSSFTLFPGNASLNYYLGLEIYAKLQPMGLIDLFELLVSHKNC